MSCNPIIKSKKKKFKKKHRCKWSTLMKASIAGLINVIDYTLTFLFNHTKIKVLKNAWCTTLECLEHFAHLIHLNWGAKIFKENNKKCHCIVYFELKSRNYSLKNIAGRESWPRCHICINGFSVCASLGILLVLVDNFCGFSHFLCPPRCVFVCVSVCVCDIISNGSMPGMEDG